MSVITIDHVTKRFGKVEVLKEFNDEFRDGEFITLLGPSGCGKTTMLRMIAGFDRPTTGEIRIDGAVVSGRDTFLPPEKRGIGMVFQSYAVWPHMNVYKNVAYPLKQKKLPKAEIQERTERILEAVHLAQYRDRMPAELSGGQQQRVALGRALVAEPSVLLLDEPLSNLDAKLREEMRFEIKELQQRMGITVVYVTHDQAEAMSMSDRVFVINAGVVQQVGSPMEIYQNPANAFVADFVGKVSFLKGTAEKGRIRIRGSEDVLPYTGELSGNVDVAIRPEHIRIVDPKEDGRTEGILRGEVLAVYFLGENSDCRVKLGDAVLRVAVDGDTLPRKGMQVGLRISRFLTFDKKGYMK